jgi:AcrR family transcriptional regulator
MVKGGASMPKKEFFNLDISKQQIIVDAARKEFTSMLYEDASINMIVKEANISRGSFYCYFENKKDIYLYIMGGEIRRMVDTLVIADDKGKIDIFAASLKLYDQVMVFYNNDDNKELIKNIMCNMKMEFEKESLVLPITDILGGLRRRVSLEKVSYSNDEELFAITGMIIHSIVEAVFQAVFKKMDCNIVRKELQFKLKVLEKGVRKDD